MSFIVPNVLRRWRQEDQQFKAAETRRQESPVPIFSAKSVSNSDPCPGPSPSLLYLQGGERKGSRKGRKREKESRGEVLTDATASGDL